MLPKARMIAALEHKEPDRVPIGELAVDWDTTDRALGVETLYRGGWRELTALWDGRRDEIVESCVQDLTGLVHKFEWDFVVVPTVHPKRDYYPKPEMLDEYCWRDAKGRVSRFSLDLGGHAMVTKYPPMAIDDLPDPKIPAQLEDSEFEAIERMVKQLGPSHFVVARVPDGTFPWRDTVGMADFLERMLTEPEFVHKSIAGATKRTLAAIEAAAALKVDGVVITIDYCDNHGPLMGPRLFREFVLSPLTECVKTAHRCGLYFIKHSDGNHWSILDDFVAAGIDGWQGIQPRIGMDLRLLKEKYAGKLALIGGVNCDTLTIGTAEEVEQEVRYAIHHAAPGGGFVMCSGNTLMHGTKYENYQAMVATTRRYGRYPIKG
ncbi:MAG: methylcobalamin:coenzyme methyltransferase [Acidobacteria bacterium]|nr:methylcobalamin:coenzyme methyltransferase [Acidobacteriota bacterium]